MRHAIHYLLGIAIACTFAAPKADAAQLVLYHNGTASHAPLGVAEGVTAYDAVTNDSEAWRVDFGTGTGASGPTPAGVTGGSSGGSQWRMFRSSATPDTAGFSSDYIGFTITNSGASWIDLESLIFDIAAASNASGGLVANYEVFVSRNGGAFVSVGGPHSVPLVADLGWGVSQETIDLTSLTGLAFGESIEFRIGLGDDSTSGSKSLFMQGIQLNGEVVPEPSTYALLGLGALAVGAPLWRRRAARRAAGR